MTDAINLFSDDEVEIMTDTPGDPILRRQLLECAATMTPSERLEVAERIDHTCVYVRFNQSTALMLGQVCPMHDWHAVADAIRALP